ncbi:MAG: aminoacyl-tRNA hydrolase [Rhodothermales bacterium]|nr:aminoacyl-tRNA hydrolase [Rhodothermales bacterium]
MAATPRLLVGLGNPGEEYEASRHNIGYRVADLLADRCRISLDVFKNQSVQGRGSWRGRRIVIAKPTTFMNRSGQAVRALMKQHRVAPNEILVIVDDIHLPLGDVRLRASGGSGGHNGVQDIIDRLGGSNFPRLRIGIGRDFSRGGQSDYVLSPFEESEEPEVTAVTERAAAAALTFVTEGVETAMSRHNRRGVRDD